MAATQDELESALVDLSERHPKLADDALFVLWFLRAFVTQDERHAAAGLTGSGKSIDAVSFDDTSKTVFVVQAKYQTSGPTEKRSDVLGFARLPQELGNARSFKEYCQGLRPDAERILVDARSRLLDRGYRLQLYYVTTGPCSPLLANDARRIARRGPFESSLRVIDGKHVLLILADYLDGIAPPVPALDLEIERQAGRRAKTVLERSDPKTGIESWVFSMSEQGVAELFEEAGTRLFARNIRGWLGSTQINRGMRTTLKNEPEYFWYYNNGVTIICDDAEPKRRSRKDILHVTNPQVINGQQTTRALARHHKRSSVASVLVRVIRVPRSDDDSKDRFETLVSKLVGSTNWQNAIRPSDLMSNDRMQIEIERQFRNLGYLYLRKRQTRAEAQADTRAHYQFVVKKEDLAQAVAACDLDPTIVREGKEGLFQEKLYSRVFPTTDAPYYLSRYWLMREVSYAARGFPERAYAKWVVLHFVWSAIAPLIRAKHPQEAFRRGCERQRHQVVEPLGRAIDKAFLAALAFFRAKRGKGATRLDVSTFFKKRKLDQEFAKYWSSPRNSRRKSFESDMSKVASGLLAD